VNAATTISKWPQSATIPQWARILGFSEATIYRYHRIGKLKGTKALNGRVTITKEAICAFLKLKVK
jgi:predicted site-specific integrase-resolvase